MKRILLIATGGTIASTEDGNGLSPALTGEELAQSVPEISGLCELDVVQPMNIDSTNMRPSDWMQIRDVIVEGYADHDGFVILHGTDTMSYTAAALSYLIQDSPKPIVLTGSQRPIDREDTDARTNLLDSLAYASDERSSGVSIVFDGKVIAGTRAKKTRTKSYNAFSSVDYPEIGVIRDGKLIRYPGEPRFFRKLNSKVGVFKLIPGVPSDILDYYFQLFDAVVIESFGAGGIPDGEYYTFGEIIERRVREGKILVMCTQVPNEGSDMCVYEVGQSAKSRFEVLETYDMTLEAAVTKLMWILSLTHDRREVEALFYETVNFDILYR